MVFTVTGASGCCWGLEVSGEGGKGLKAVRLSGKRSAVGAGRYLCPSAR